MNPLMRRLPRELKNNLGRYVGIFILMIVAISFTTGFLAAASSIQAIMSTFRDDYTMEDFRFATTEEAGDEAIEAVEDLDATVYENFELNVEARIDGSDVTVRAVKHRTKVDTAAYEEGRAPKASDEIAIDRTFAAHHGIEIGDTVKLLDKKYEVTGIMILPDYNALMESNTDFVMNTLTFTTAELTSAAYNEIAESGSSKVIETYVYSALLDDRDMELVDRLDVEADAARELTEHGVEVNDFIDYDSNQGINYALDDTEGDSVMWEVMLYMIIVIMGFVFVVLTSSTIDEESAIIGTLLASGYTKGELLLHYLVLPTVVGVVGSIVGNVLGYTLVMEPMKNLYYNSYSLPPFVVTFDWAVFVKTTVLPLALLIGTTAIGLLWRLRATPLMFLRHEKAGKTRRHGLGLPDGLGFVKRFQLRVFLRNAPHFVILFFGISFASILLMFGLCLMPVIENAADLMSENLVATHQYTLKAAVPLEPGTSNGAEAYCAGAVELPRWSGDANEELTVYGIEEDSRYWTDVDVSDGAVVIGSGVAEKCDVAAGETVVLHNKYADEDYRVTVSAVTGNAMDMNVYMSREKFCDLFGKEDGYFNGYASNNVLNIDSKYISSDLTSSEMTKMVDQMRDSMGDMTDMLLALAVIIYLVLVYLLTKTVIDRAARAISYLKVFGYTDREVNRLYVWPITIVVLASLVLCIPLLIEGLTLLMKVAMADMAGNFVIVVPPDKLAIEVGVGAVAYLAVAALHVWHIRRVPMEEALKVQE